MSRDVFGDRPPFRERVIFYAMREMARWRVLPRDMRGRFARSADKRDPKRIEEERRKSGKAQKSGGKRKNRDKAREKRLRKDRDEARKKADQARNDRDKAREKLAKVLAEQGKAFEGGPTGRTDTIRVSREMREFQAHQFDPAWYAERHGLDGPDAAWAHFMDDGSRRYYAPRAELAEGKTARLSQWGAEYVLRCGIPVGGRGEAPLDPGDPSALKAFSLTNPRGKRVAVVSAVFGEYDRLLPVDPAWTENADFFLFSDRKFENRTAWQPVHANYFHSDPRRQARFVKTHLTSYFAAYDRVMWVDGNILLCAEPGAIIDAYGLDGVDFAAFRHHQRRNLVAEAHACAQRGKEDPHFVLSHLKQNAEHPGFRRPVLFETMAMVLSPDTASTRALCRNWWRYILKGSKRDQLSLPLAVSDTADLSWSYFEDDDISKSPYFLRVSH